MNFCLSKTKLYIICFILFILLISFPQNVAASTSTVSFSIEEQSYINSKQVLRIAVVPSWKPYCYSLSAKENSYNGYSIELLDELCKQTGLQLEFVPVKTYAEGASLLQIGSVDINAIEFSPKRLDAPSENIIPYLVTSVQVFAHKDTNLLDTSALTVASVDGISFLASQPYQDKLLSIYSYPTIEDCINAVRSLRADVVICDQYTAAGLGTFPLTKDLLLRDVPAHEVTVGFGILQQENPLLYSIVQKGVASVSIEKRSLILTNHYDIIAPKSDIILFVYQHPFEIICALLSLGFVAVICLVTYMRVHLRQHQILHGYEDGFRMLANNLGGMGVEYDYIQDRLTVFGNKHELLDLPDVVENFRTKLENRELNIYLSETFFKKLLASSHSSSSYEFDIQCGLRGGGKNWFRMIYIIVSTEESHRRPIRLIGSLVDVEHEYLERNELKELSTKDSLTGLFNRRACEELILQRLSAECQFDVVALIDLDYFKNLNDTYGHLCGDDALHTFAMTLIETFQEDTILCRWGGDEFLLYYQNAFPLTTLKEKFLLIQKRMKTYCYKGAAIPITLSIGCIKITPGIPWEELFSKTDSVLYSVKENGRDSFLIVE